MTSEAARLVPRRRMLAALGLGVAAAASMRWAASAAGLEGRCDKSWVLYYGAEADLETLAGFDVVVLDPLFARPIAPLTERVGMVFGYISLGEISSNAPYFPMLRDPAVLLQENKNWPGSFAVDLRQRAWTSLILKTVIPSLLERGFQGLFLDTLDSAAFMEETDPGRNRGMQEAAVRLVRAIHRAYPAVPLLMNRGYALLPKLADVIDGIVAESLITTYDFKTKTYHWVEPATVAEQLELLRPAREQKLPIFSLDYWDPQDTATVRLIYERERAMGHAPYVSTILLDRLIPEPRT